MKAIITKYIPCTNTRPARIKATACGVPALMMSWSEAEDSHLDGVEGAHYNAANALKMRQGWTGELIGGGLPDGTGYAFVFARK